MVRAFVGDSTITRLLDIERQLTPDRVAMSIFAYASPPPVTVARVSKYVALEGVDGSGKSTVAAELSEALKSRGFDVIVVREPGGTKVGEAIRDLLLHSDALDDWAEVFLFAAQRSELARTVIAPALEAGTWVVSDRTYYSSIAYQGRARGLGEQRIREINEVGLNGTLPDHVFVLDVSPEVALARQDGPDRIGSEGVGFQSEVRESYRSLAHTDAKVHLLEGNREVAAIVAEILETVL